MVGAKQRDGVAGRDAVALAQPARAPSDGFGETAPRPHRLLADEHRRPLGRPSRRAVQQQSQIRAAHPRHRPHADIRRLRGQAAPPGAFTTPTKISEQTPTPAPWAT
jgi:hypothetical protein